MIEYEEIIGFSSAVTEDFGGEIKRGILQLRPEQKTVISSR